MDLKEEKKCLRRAIKERKRLTAKDEKLRQSSLIFSAIERSEVFTQAKVLLLYWSMDDEVATHDFILKWYKLKTILLPCVKGDDLILRRFDGMETMTEGEQFAILEPTGEIFSDYSQIDLMIIPGVAFDRAMHRMGRGRGFYDRLLSVTDAKKAGVCFDFQLVESVPVEEFDVKMDFVVSDKGFVGNE